MWCESGKTEMDRDAPQTNASKPPLIREFSLRSDAPDTKSNAHFVQTFTVLGRKTGNELAKAFNSRSRQGDGSSFFQNHGVIHLQRLCSYGHQMALSVVSNRSLCTARQCRQDVGLQMVTRSRIKVSTVILFIYCWSKYVCPICEHFNKKMKPPLQKAGKPVWAKQLTRLL